MAVKPIPTSDHKETPTKKGFLTKNKIIIIGGVLLVLGLSVGVGLFVAKKMYPAKPKGAAHAVEKVEAKVEHKDPIFMKLEPITLNLSGDDEAMLQVQVSLELASKETQAKLEGYLPRINGRLLMLYSAETKAAWLSAEGKERLMKSSLLAIRKALGQAETDASMVVAVEFIQLIVQ